MADKHLVVGVRASRAVGVARVLVEQALVEVSKLRAAKIASNRLDRLVDQVKHGAKLAEGLLESGGEALLQQVEGKASEAVLGGQRRRVVDTAGQVRDVQADEAVGRAGVATELDSLGVSSVADGQVLKDVVGAVLVVGRALVPVLGNLLLAAVPHERAGLTRDREELLEVVPIEVARRLLSRVVTHEVNHKIVCNGDNDEGGEGAGEVVGVLGDGLVLDLAEAAAELVQGVAVLGAADGVDLLELLDEQRVGVAVVGVGVGAAWEGRGLAWSRECEKVLAGLTDGSVTLVVVVAVRQTLAVAEQRAGQVVGRERAANAPHTLDDVAVQGDGVGGKSDGKLGGHAVERAEAGDGLLNRRNAAAGQVAVVGSRVQARARAADVGGAGRGVGVVAGDRDELVLGVEGLLILVSTGSL